MADGTTFCDNRLPERGRDFMSLESNRPRAPSAAGPLIHQPEISRYPAVSASQSQSAPSIDEFFAEYPHMVLGAPWLASCTTFNPVVEAAMILQVTQPELLNLANSIPVTSEAFGPALTTAPAPQLAGHGYYQSITEVQAEQELQHNRKLTSSIMSVDGNQGPSYRRTTSQAESVPEKAEEEEEEEGKEGKEGSVPWHMLYRYSPAYRFKVPNVSDTFKKDACLYVSPFDGTQCWTKKYDAQPADWLRGISGPEEAGFFHRHISETLRHLAIHRQAEASAVKNRPELARLATEWNDVLIDGQIIKDRDNPGHQIWYMGEKRKSREELNQQLAASVYYQG